MSVPKHQIHRKIVLPEKKGLEKKLETNYDKNSPENYLIGEIVDITISPTEDFKGSSLDNEQEIEEGDDDENYEEDYEDTFDIISKDSTEDIKQESKSDYLINGSLTEFSSITFVNIDDSPSKFVKWKQEVESGRRTTSRSSSVRPSSNSTKKSVIPNSIKPRKSKKGKFEKITFQSNMLPKGIAQASITSQSIVSSKIAPSIQLSENELRMQLNTALKKLKNYQLQNDELQIKLDQNHNQEVFDKLKFELISKEMKLEELLQENDSLKAITRYQSKQLNERAGHRNAESDTIVSQEKYSEVLAQHIKRLKEKLSQSKKVEEEQNEMIRQYEVTIKKMRSKISKQNKTLAHLKEMIYSNGEEEFSVPKLSKKEAKKAECSSPSSQEEYYTQLIEKLEKKYSTQIKIYQKDNLDLKSNFDEVQNDRKRIESELNKRDIALKNQYGIIKSLRKSYEELLETTNQLLEASALYNRDHSEISIKPSFISRDLNSPLDSFVEDTGLISKAPQIADDDLLDYKFIGSYLDDNLDIIDNINIKSDEKIKDNTFLTNTRDDELN